MIESLAYQYKRKRAFTLVLILLILSLITAFIISFFVIVTAEGITAKNEAVSSNARRLSDTAVQIVMSQIRDATLDGAGNNAWASQPGAIRTYDSSGANSQIPSQAAMLGKNVKVFKLYSDSNMVDDTGTYNPTNDWATKGWSNAPELYTDLNAPAQGIYPIFDPAVAGTMSALSPSATYTQGNVDGLYLYSAAQPLTDTNNTNKAAMPVKWLYMLKDGEVIAPDSTETTPGTLTFSNAKNPLGAPCTINGVTFNNEITGRIAFWTDDETCKLNINTASEGIPWENPFYNRADEVAWAAYQPAAFEFQRIPGHPATTSLSPVFWNIFQLGDPNYSTWTIPSVAITSATDFLGGGDPKPQLLPKAPNYLAAIFGVSGNSPKIPGLNSSNYSPAITPRSVTYDTGSNCGQISTGVDITTQGLIGQTLTVNHNRLYADIDELQFSPPKNAATPTLPYIRFNSGYGGVSLSSAQVSQIRFLLTTESQAPEVNLFHQPRVSIWPVPDLTNSPFNSTAMKTQLQTGFNINQRSTIDKLMMSCASIGKDSLGNPLAYFFTRYDPTSSTNDYSNILRNRQLYAYIRNAMDNRVPGFGNAYSSRDGPNACDELTTLFFDYIRSCINLCDSSMGTTVPVYDGAKWYSGNENTWLASSYTVPPRFTNVGISNGVSNNSSNVPQMASVPGTGQVAPILITTPNGTNTKGMGRFPLVRDVTLVFYADYADQPPYYVDKNRRPCLPGSTSPLIADPSLQVTLGLNPTQVANLTHDPIIPLTGSGSAPDRPLNANQISTLLKAATLNPMHPFVIISDVSSKGAVYTAGNPRVSNTSPFPTTTGTPLLIGGYTDEYPTVNYMLNPSAGTGQGETHPGLPYIPVLNPATGAYDMKNTAYTGPALKPHESSIEVGTITDLCNPEVGNPALGASYEMSVNTTGMSLDNTSVTINPSTQIFTPGSDSSFMNSNFAWSLNNYKNATTAPISKTAIKVGTSNAAEPNGSTFSFSGCNVNISLKYAIAGTVVPGNPTQTYNIYFPAPTLTTAGTGFFPTPKLNIIQNLAPTTYTPAPTKANPTPSSAYGDLPVINSGYPNGHIGVDPNNKPAGLTGIVTLANSIGGLWGSSHLSSTAFPSTGCVNPLGGAATSNCYDYVPSVTFRSIEANYGDVRTEACFPAISDQSNPAGTNNFFIPATNYSLYSTKDQGGNVIYLRGGTSFRGQTAYPLGAVVGSAIRSLNDMVLKAKKVNSTVPPYDIYANYFEYITQNNLGIATPNGLENYVVGNGIASPVIGLTTDMGDTLGFYNQVWAVNSDFDCGINGNQLEGPFLNKADEGSVGVNKVFNSDNAYYSPTGTFLNGGNLFSPTRQVPSAVVFGSLPVGIDPTKQDITKAWKTLQFSPNPNLSDAAYAASSNRATNPPNPPDYLLLDLFQMPVVQPYAISGPLFTSGKVNMNYQIAPFSYITRNTAIRGVLKNTPITASEDQDVGTLIGTFNAGANANNNSSQYPIHLKETLRQFDYRFINQNDLFHSATEICSLWLYPGGQPTSKLPANSANAIAYWDPTNTGIMKWWYSGTGTTRKGETGDNLRERPYAELYPRLTTQSNSYTVHYRVQVLKQAQGTDKTKWLEPNTAGTIGVRDSIQSEYRGSSLIERYVDPNDTTLPDFATTGGNIDTYYKFRVVSTRRFAP